MEPEKEPKESTNLIDGALLPILLLASVASSIIAARIVLSGSSQFSIWNCVWFLYCFLGCFPILAVGLFLFFGAAGKIVCDSKGKDGSRDLGEYLVLLIPVILGCISCLFPNFFEVNVCKSCKVNLSDYSVIIKTDEGTFCPTCGMEYMKENDVLFEECDACGDEIYQEDLINLNGYQYCGSCYSYIEIERIAQPAYNDGYNDGYSDGFYMGSEY